MNDGLPQNQGSALGEERKESLSLDKPETPIAESEEQAQKELMKLAIDQMAGSTRKLGKDYIPEMPKISQIGMMTPQEVFDYLSTLETSMYKAIPIAEILATITITEGYRYLTELSILNEKEKSNLEDISDKSIDQELGSSERNPSVNQS